MHVQLSSPWGDYGSVEDASSRAVHAPHSCHCSREGSTFHVLGTGSAFKLFPHKVHES